MKIWILIPLLLLPALAGAVCQPDEGMTKSQVYDLCGPPDYAEVVHGDSPETAIPLASDDADLLKGGQPTVLWHYDLFEDQKSRIILFRNGQVVRCCLPDTD